MRIRACVLQQPYKPWRLAAEMSVNNTNMWECVKTRFDCNSGFFTHSHILCGFPIVVSGASWGDSQRTHTPLDSGEPAQETAVRKQPVTWRALSVMWGRA